MGNSKKEVVFVAYSFKGSISFGFVYIPITLQQAAKEDTISFHLLDKKTKSKIKYKKTCEACNGKEVLQKDIVKGFEYEEGKYVIFENEDFEKIKSKKEKNIVIDSFVELNEVDPIFFQKPYYVIPSGAYKAYQLLQLAMEEEHKAAIAKMVLGTKETLVLIRSKNQQMLLNTLYFQNEIRKSPVKKIDESIETSELKLAKALIQQMSKPFRIDQYKNEYNEKIISAIEKKISGKTIKSTSKNEPSEAINLMEALQASLENSNSKQLKKRSTRSNG